ncbi:MAG: lysophospholipid acyltransferase family protein [Saprospiraceae bacterium]|nr:lysophospholipid acyltransferase family protein [Saprospiraceae bacterium]
MNDFNKHSNTPIKYAPVYLISCLPLRLLQVISEILYSLLFFLSSYRKNVVKNNLKAAFPEKNEVELKIISRDFYRHFSELIVETLKAATLSASGMKKRFVLENPELIHKLFNSGKSVSIYAAHLGNWEWYAAFPLQLNLPVYGLYLPLSNAYFDGLIASIRRRFGLYCVPAAKAYKFLLDRWKSGEVNVSLFIGDQSPPGPDNCYWTYFLNQKTAFIHGTEAIARKNSNAVVFPWIYKSSFANYRVRFELLWDGEEMLSDHEITERYARCLEKAIQSDPRLWLWSHRRWKHKRTDADPEQGQV